MARTVRGGVVRSLLLGVLVVGSSALACPTPASADWLGDEQAVTTGSGTRQWPQLSGSRLVYSAETANGFDIRVRNLATGTDQVLTPDHSATGKAAISGTRVVWTDSGNGLWVDHLTTGMRRRLPVAVGDDPSISGTRVCYSSLGRVHVYDLRTESDRTVSPASGEASNCDISGSVVVWQDERDGNADIFRYDVRTNTESRVTTDPAAQTKPRVDDGVVIWQDERAGTDDADLYAEDLATGTRTLISESAGAQSFADVADGRIVWMDTRAGHGNTDVYLYDLASGVETQVTTDDGWSGNPTISGDRIVYEEARASGHNLFRRTLTPPELTVAPAPLDDAGLPGLEGRLTSSDGLPVVGVTVRLESSSDDRTWIDAGSAVTAGDGSYEFALPDSIAPSRIRVRFSGAQDVAPTVSDPVYVQPPR